ncbi:MAG: sulfite exporter TauE/SafE family protein [Planctomycetes bacterium]|nr:sulfite exporter TauE/SafE family protein [Pseudomonadota bacterium]MCP4711712.1 sulfite exporter TauE/SafE family protein [Planctomycetota bacterium]
MFYQITNIDVHPLIPFLVAVVISFFTSMGGISGAFLLLPFQVSILGFASPAVSATNQLFNIVAIPSGVYRYMKEGRMVWPLAWVVIIGTLPGVFVGAILRIQYLPDPRSFKMFVALVLVYIGGRLLKDIIGNRRSAKNSSSAEETLPKPGRESPTQSESNRSVSGQASLSKVLVKEIGLRRIVYEFRDRDYHIRTMGVMGLSLIVGIIGGIYGIGGGAIIAPFFVSVFRLPVHTVAGATLMGTFLTSIAGVVFYQAIAPFYPDIAVAPEYELGLLFGAGGFVGMYFGARLQKFISARVIKWILVCSILFTAGNYIKEFIWP